MIVTELCSPKHRKRRISGTVIELKVIYFILNLSRLLLSSYLTELSETQCDSKKSSMRLRDEINKPPVIRESNLEDCKSRIPITQILRRTPCRSDTPT